MATTKWPDPTDLVTTDALDNDADSLVAARLELEKAVEKVNAILTACDLDATVTTSTNDGVYMKAVGTAVANELMEFNASGHPQRSQQITTTSAPTGTSNDTTIPTSKAVNTAIQANIGSGPTELPGQNYAAATQFVFPHGLGREPYTIEIVLINISGSTQAGYPNGTRLRLGTSTAAVWGSSNQNESGHQVWADSTNVYMSVSTLYIMAATGGGLSFLGSGDWRIVPQVT